MAERSGGIRFSSVKRMCVLQRAEKTPRAWLRLVVRTSLRVEARRLCFPAATDETERQMGQKRRIAKYRRLIARSVLERQQGHSRGVRARRLGDWRQ